MAWGTIRVRKEGGKAVLTLNRPERLNALSLQSGREFRAALTELNEASDVRVLTITAEGRGFCSGADLTGDDNPSEPNAWLYLWHGLIRQMRSFRRPIIAAVNGIAAGAGLSLATACDVRFASEDARFSAIFVRRALSVDCGLSYTLPRIVGLSNAFRLMYSGEIIDARSAESMGLVSKVVPPQDLPSAADELATTIANGPPLAITAIRRATYSALASDLDAALDLEQSCNQALSFTDDVQEGMQAFREKRLPVFKGR